MRLRLFVVGCLLLVANLCFCPEVSGAPLLPSIWLTQNPHAQLPNHKNEYELLACIENREFRDWIKDFMTILLRDYPLDGVIWDEPKGFDQISKHPDTLKKYGTNPTAAQMEDSFTEFLQELTTHCHSVRDDLTVTLFHMPHVPESATTKTGAVEGIDCVGFDGHIARDSFFHEPPRDGKAMIEHTWKRVENESRMTGKKTFALVENMLLPKEVMGEYEENLESFLSKHRPDHLALYFYGHNNEDPDTVYQIMKKMMQKYLV